MFSIRVAAGVGTPFPNQWQGVCTVARTWRLSVGETTASPRYIQLRIEVTSSARTSVYAVASNGCFVSGPGQTALAAMSSPARRCRNSSVRSQLHCSVKILEDIVTQSLLYVSQGIFYALLQCLASCQLRHRNSNNTRQHIPLRALEACDADIWLHCPAQHQSSWSPFHCL